MDHMNDTELAEYLLNVAKARTSLACEGRRFTDDDEALFERLAAERLPAAQRHERQLAFVRARLEVKAPTAG
jgi:hypothetical protein